MDRPLHLHLKPSCVAQYYCAAIIFLSCLAIVLAALPLLVHVLLIAVVGVYGWHAIRHLRLLPVQTLEHRSGCWFVCVDDVLQSVDLEKNIFLGYGIISLSFILPTGRKKRVVLWPDSADADSLRRLRAALLAQ
jgi:hypothetical protein